MIKNTKLILLILFLLIMISLFSRTIHYLYSGANKMTSTLPSKVPLAVYYVTAPNEQQAKNLSKLLLEAKLIACCNIVNNVKSIYTWEGKVQEGNEVLMVMKSRQELIQSITQLVNKHHSYDCPEVIAMPIIGGSDKYMTWVVENTVSSKLQSQNL